MKEIIRNIEKKLAALTRFCYAHTLLLFGTIKEANAHCTQLQITQAYPQPKFAKECNFYNPQRNTALCLNMK